ncbi:MAG: type I methionyl aminopeptidase [Oscillospiraceae bacterium]|nr:type I methionyl aminopeptidase [Oscillospiraceae bacterium]
MIRVKSAREVELMRQAGRITAAARAYAGKMVAPGVTTLEIDKAVNAFIRSKGAVPTFLHYGGFPKSVCISINDEIIHGIPGKRVIKEGDLVKIDVGATKDGYVGDCAATFIAGKGTEEARRLVEVTRQSFFEGIKYARPGCRVSDIGAAVQEYVEKHGYSVIRDYVGHGVGAVLHEDPEVPNYGVPGHGPRLVRGMTIAVEPMVAMGDYACHTLANDWTVVTNDGSLAAHYENSLLITDGEPELLTWPEGFDI